jgi:uncharacterized protein YndB with AHSA1/START domain
MTDSLSLRISKVVNAPRSKVFAAFTTPAILAKWFAPGTRQAEAKELDVRPGGRYAIVMKGETDQPTAVGEYREVVNGTKLVFTWGWDGDPSQPTLVTVTFADKGKGTEVVLVHERFATTQSRDSHSEGWQSIFDKLSTIFATV